MPNLNDVVPPQTMEFGWPVKTFVFTGEWAKEPLHPSARRCARRNNPEVERPIYTAEDGETVVMGTIYRKISS